VRESARESQCKNNLKAIGLALHNYHDRWQSFPPAYTVDAQGRRLHSWRVLILPFLGQQGLYNSIDLSQPWDSPVNAPFLATRPPEFGCPSDVAPGATSTNYVAVVGDKCVFRGEKSVSIQEITDGTSNTILVGEVVGTNIPWMKPDDLSLSSFRGFSSKHSDAVHFLMCDGSVHSMPSKPSLPATPAPAQFTREGSDW
jgi:prepilin-type processing-associated H-X9-DG protein